MQNVSPFAVLTIAPFLIAVVVIILAFLGQFGAKKQAKWLRKNMPIGAILQQCEQGLLPLVLDGSYVYHLRGGGIAGFVLVNPTSNRVLRIGDDEQVMAMLKRWGYSESWRVGAIATAKDSRPRREQGKEYKQGAVTEVDTHKVY